MLWLALDFPQLALVVHTRGLKTDKTQALAVVDNGRVLSCNAHAAQAGVKVGHNTASAMALCHALRFLERLPSAEEQLLAQIAEACFALTPTVVLVAPHNILLEISGSLKLFHGQAGLLRQLRKRLRHFQVEEVLAQAPTAKAALLLAQSPAAATSLELPAPVTMQACIPLLRQAPVQYLPWDADRQKKMRHLGLCTVGELLDLPRSALSKRLGVDSTQYLARLLGELPDPLPPLQPAETFSSSVHFLDGVSHSDGLRFPIKRLLNELCQFLRQRQWTCTRFHWKFHHQDKSRQQLLISASRGEPQVARLLTLTELKLENFSINAPVESLTLEAVEFRPQTDTRLALMPTPGQEDMQALELLDRLRARLGHDACLRLSAHASHRPEVMQTLGPELNIAPPPKPDSRHPFWLSREASPIRQIEGKLWWHGELEIIRGPECICMPWWEGEEKRSYFTARHRNGGYYWIYFSEPAQEWFCQGLG